MASIKNIDAQKAALKRIESLIKEIKVTNHFLSETNESGEYTISFDKCKTPLICEDKSLIDELVNAYKQKLVKEIESLAQTNNIELDEEERQIMA